MTARSRLQECRARKLSEDLPNRVRELAEAGAKGRPLTPIEVRELCEALSVRSTKRPTYFHTGFG